MKRRQRDSSSFDLFLDTICNTFGGIVFLAILLAIMIQTRAIVSTANDRDPQMSADELRTVTLRIDQLASERNSLQFTIESLPESTENEADVEYAAARDLARRRDAELVDLLENHAILATALAKQMEANAEQRLENERVPAELAENQERLRNTLSEYAGVIESKQQTLRLPRVRSSEAASVLVLVQNDFLFLAKKPSLFGSGFDPDYVVATSLAGGDIQVEPIQNAGWNLTDRQQLRKFAELVRESRQAGHAITIAIWPESYHLFPVLRQQMIDENVFYQLWPKSSGEQLVVFLGAGTTRIQ